MAQLVTSLHQCMKRVGIALQSSLMEIELLTFQMAVALSSFIDRHLVKAVDRHLETVWKKILSVIQSLRMRSDARLYKEDTVQCTEHEGLIGIVMEVAERSNSIPKGCARISWTNNSESTEKIDDIAVLDRAFFHGGIVAAASHPSGQIGVVVAVDVTVDLSSAITNISTRNLRRIRAFARGDYVTLGPWLGRVDEVADDVTVIFDDGSKCKLMNAHPDHLIPISKNLPYPYFPGQRVCASSSALFKNGIWLCGKWKENSEEGTVCDLEVGSVCVRWIAVANPGYNSQSSIVPAKKQNPKQLKLLSCFSHANWRLGDWCLLPASEKRKSKVTDNIVDGKGKSKVTDNIVDGVLTVSNKWTKVDVIWQDGTRKCGVDSRTLIPIYDLGDHDFFPEQYVLKGDSDVRARRVGVVKKVNWKERRASVRWLKSVDCPGDTGKFDGEEMVSVYELAKHPAYNYSIGGIVMRFAPVSGETEVPGIVNQLVAQIDCKDETITKNDVETTNQKTLKEKQKAELDKSLEESNLSWFGNVIGSKDGDIQVAWADGMVSKVGPQQILVIGKHERDAEQIDEHNKVDPAKREISDFPLVKWIANKLDVKLAKEKETVVHNWSRSNWHESGHFKHFDSVNNPLDHFYVKETGQPTNMKQKWIKKVQQEWNILEKNLPDTIFVRIYEDRMDLLRAVIVGAAGTPYQDGLFFFDIHFPSKYPDVPPQAFYHSGGLRLNPNLYENGKVCLSLLNTWMGRVDEVWNPSLSNVLQVLVSIQGLVLNDNPYFNEPLFQGQINSAEGEKNSLTYKEDTFLVSCKSMLYILRKPPKHFEMFVKEHFRKRGHYILRACDAYIKGAPVGSLSEDCTLPPNFGAESQKQNRSSVSFKLMLVKIVPKLISAFMKLE